MRQVRRGCPKAVLGGWNLAGILRYESGRPLNITMDNDLGGFLFNGQKRPNRDPATDPVVAIAATSIRTPTATSTRPHGPIRGRCNSATRRSATAPSAAFPIYSEDMNIFKVFPLRNDRTCGSRRMFGNIFNRTLFCDPNTNWSSGSFGTGHHAVQPAAVDSARVEVRFLDGLVYDRHVAARTDSLAPWQDGHQG